MKVLAEIFSQGEEIVSGQTLDTNATWLARHLTDIGFRVRRHTTVGDQLSDLVCVFREISTRADLCICTGGLGPTSDDLTAEALSLVTGQKLVFDVDALTAIESYFIRRNRSMPDSNRKQAYLPNSSIRINNPVGTAPGFSLQFEGCLFICLPGVPAEMKAMVIQSVLPQLAQQFQLQPDRLISLRTVGIGESAIQEILKCLTLPSDVELGYRAALGEVQVKLLFPDTYVDSEIYSLVDTVKQMLGDVVYSIDGLGEESGDLLTVIDQQMCLHNKHLFISESVSYGLVAQRCFAYEWLKNAHLLHPDSCISSANLYHPNADKQLYPNAIHLSQICSQSAKEIADPDLSVNLNIRLGTHSTVYHKEVVLAGNLEYKQQQAANYTLDFLRRYLFNLCL